MWPEVTRFLTSLIAPIANITAVEPKIGLLRCFLDFYILVTNWFHDLTSHVAPTQRLTQYMRAIFHTSMISFPTNHQHPFPSLLVSPTIIKIFLYCNTTVPVNWFFSLQQARRTHWTTAKVNRHLSCFHFGLLWIVLLCTIFCMDICLHFFWAYTQEWTVWVLW